MSNRGRPRKPPQRRHRGTGRAATVADLEKLHAALCGVLIEQVTLMAEGKTEIRTGVLNVAIDFLKDNGCTKNLERVKDIRDSLNSLNSLALMIPLGNS